MTRWVIDGETVRPAFGKGDGPRDLGRMSFDSEADARVALVMVQRIRALEAFVLATHHIRTQWGGTYGTDRICHEKCPACAAEKLLGKGE